MTDRPILMSSPMVLATLAELKTNTRRLPSKQPGEGYNPSPDNWHLHTRYEIGDRLWVRESFADCHTMGFDSRFYYMADTAKGSEGDDLRKHFGVEWKPSIHMPRAASRLTLIVTGVKVERLQDISEEDAEAEGIYWETHLGWTYGDGIGNIEKASFAFRQLWQSLNAKRAPWDNNPWVVAIAFKAHKCNIDQLEKENVHGMVSQNDPKELRGA